MASALDRAVSAFGAAFGRPPCWAARAPGRVNMIGEHTDYNGGLVLPMAVGRDCIAVGAPAQEGARSRVLMLDLGIERAFELHRPLSAVRAGDPTDVNKVPLGSPESYIAGVLAKWQHRIGPLPNLRIAIASDVPLGAGLSSSAAVEVATATLLEAVTGISLEHMEKAKLCQRAEHEFAGVPCGIMDQLASVQGQRGRALLIDCRDDSVIHIPLPPASSAAWLVVNSRVRHSLAAGEYAARRAACEAVARVCGVSTVRDVDAAALEANRPQLPDEQYRCAVHVLSENDRVLQMAQALEAGRLKDAGRLMLDSHASLRDDFRVSCVELDALVESLASIEGVFGARMTGAGFGGCVIALIRRDACERAAARITAEYRGRFTRDPDAFEVHAASGAAILSL